MKSLEGRGQLGHFGGPEIDASAPQPRIYVEVGLGDMRVRGYGHDFPFRPNDLYLAMDLPRIQRIEIVRSIDEPLIPAVPIARSHLGKLMLETEVKLLKLDKKVEAGLEISIGKKRRLEKLYDALETIGGNMDDIRNFTREQGIRYLPMYADGQVMPLADNQADDVLFSNIFGDKFVQTEEKFALLHEASRVLRSDAGITIVESRKSDTAAKFMNELSSDEWKVKCYEEASPEWPELKARYNRLKFSAQPERSTGATVYFIEPVAHDPYESAV